ncbi:hypothetical protein [Candidatus Phycosocius spiralis]|uniref:Uncharacterized protein n=1 Tax=Candidatus Phycosocius spiralis TaxID=2815099 RepID=A0ABQ4PX56_9PROT|nr:hypothetical protein [Candidatus Phycosocius spiralis]GIU67603.1 hypothetical protein PsB1_1757 [Candidatus Phycosocius spiralis]
MKVLTDEQIAALRTIVLATTHANSHEVWSLLERVKLEGNRPNAIIDLLETLRQAGIIPNFLDGVGKSRIPGFDRLFWEPFSGLFASQELSNLVPGSLPRQGLAQVWHVISTQLANDVFTELDPLIRDASLKGDVKGAQNLANGYRDVVLERISDVSDEQLAILGDTPESSLILDRLRPLLLANKLNNELWTGSQSRYGDMHENSIMHLTKCVRKQEAHDIKVGVELMLLNMSTLDKPFHILRVVKKLLPTFDDIKIDTTPYGLIGRRILGLIHQQSQLIWEEYNKTIFNAQRMINALNRHILLANGLSKSQLLNYLGPWQQELTEICSRTGQILEDICEGAVTALEQVLPRESVRKGKIATTILPRVSVKIDSEAVQVARSYLEFLSAIRHLANEAGIAVVSQKVIKSCADYLDFTADALVQLVYENNPSRYLDDYIWATTLLYSALDGNRAATGFERRIAALKSKQIKATKMVPKGV